MLWHTHPARLRRTPPAGFFQPCQPTLVAVPPAGPGWLHEMKPDGFRNFWSNTRPRARPETGKFGGNTPEAADGVLARSPVFAA
jgi:hypothetical protein